MAENVPRSPLHGSPTQASFLLSFSAITAHRYHIYYIYTYSRFLHNVLCHEPFCAPSLLVLSSRLSTEKRPWLLISRGVRPYHWMSPRRARDNDNNRSCCKRHAYTSTEEEEWKKAPKKRKISFFHFEKSEEKKS